MLHFSKRQLVFALLLGLLLAAAGWFYSQRVTRVAMAAYVPESALGYVEINDWPQLLDRLTNTKAWQELAPAYGLAGKLDYAGKLGGLAQFTGALGGDVAMLARSQFAVVVTGLEVRNEQGEQTVKPRWALLAETHTRAGTLRKVIEQRLPEAANRLLGQTTQEQSEYGGVAVMTYRSGPERQLLSAQIEGEWILANHLDPLRACIDARLGRTPALAGSFYLQQARPVVERSGDLFGFVTGEGVTRLLRFGAHLVTGGALAETQALEGVLTDFSLRAANGVAYGLSFENGAVVDRYVWLFKPELTDGLRAALKVKQNEARVLSVLPAAVDEATIIKVENPQQVLTALETTISTRVGAAQSFLLHQVLLGARESFFSLKAGASAAALGDEIASIGSADEDADRVWLLAVRDRAAMTRLIENFLAQGGAALRREPFGETEIVSSSNAQRGAAAFIGDFLAHGPRAEIVRLLELRRSGQSLASAPQFANASKPAGELATLSVSSVKDETQALLLTLARQLGTANAPQSVPALERLPLAVSGLALRQEGVYVESHAPLGNFPLLASLLDKT